MTASAAAVGAVFALAWLAALLEAVHLALLDIVPVVEEDLLAALDALLGEDADVVVATHAQDASVRVGLVGVVGEASAAALAARIDHLHVVQIEEIRRGAPVVDLSASVGLFMANELATVVDQKVVGLHGARHEGAPAGDWDGRRPNQQRHLLAQLDRHVAAALAVGPLRGAS